MIYFIFNEGYTAHEGDELIRLDLCREALRLARLVAGSSLAQPRVHAVVALLALQAARNEARVDAAGNLILLDEQDRSRWDQKLISLGFHHFDLSMAGDQRFAISRRGRHRGHPCAGRGDGRDRLAHDPGTLRSTAGAQPFAR